MDEANRIIRGNPSRNLRSFRSRPGGLERSRIDPLRRTAGHPPKREALRRFKGYPPTANDGHDFSRHDSARRSTTKSCTASPPASGTRAVRRGTSSRSISAFLYKTDTTATPGRAENLFPGSGFDSRPRGPEAARREPAKAACLAARGRAGAAAPGDATSSDIGFAVQSHVEAPRFSSVVAGVFVGHGNRKRASTKRAADPELSEPPRKGDAPSRPGDGCSPSSRW